MSENPAGAGDRRLLEQLQRLVRAIEASGRAILPRSNEELLSSIVEAAARIFGAAAASIALVDEKEGCLEFRVAYGVGREQIIGMRIPLDQGVAGYVVMTGQSLAISDVQHDSRFSRATAEQTGYVPRSLLAMPLVRGDRVIGVMEVLDKISAPAFGMQDMELLGLFARQAAIAIDQSQSLNQLNDTIVRGMEQIAAGDAHAASGEILAALRSAEGAAPELGELADLFNSISTLGDAEKELCVRTLRAFAEYARSRPGF